MGWERIRPYAEGVIAMIAVTLIRLPLEQYLENRSPFAFYYPAIAYATWRFGFWPGFVTATVSGTTATFFFIEPFGSLVPRTTSDTISIVFYFISALAICWLGELNQRARRRVEELNRELEKRVEERTAELLAKNEDLEGFAYSVSHDLRSPLRAVVATSRIVLSEEGDRLTEEGRENLERQASSALRLSALVDDLLKYSRLGRREVRVSDVDLSRLAHNVWDIVGNERPNCEVYIEDGLRAKGDPILLGLVFQNLFDNACKYAQPGQNTLVRLESVEVEGRTAICVSDNGIGFDMAHADKLFRPFERLHSDLAYSGTGIGLANVSRIVERHGGRVWAESEPGRGARFYFTLWENSLPKGITKQAAVEPAVDIT